MKALRIAWPNQDVLVRWMLLTVGLAACLASVSGCSDGRPKRVKVSGTVTIDGQPLTRGNVKFVPSGGRPSSGKLDEQGRFTLTCYDGNDGAIPGRHRVQIAASRIISDRKIEWFAPRKYADFRRSGIEIEIEQNTDDLVIELEWGKKKGPYVETL